MANVNVLVSFQAKGKLPKQLTAADEKRLVENNGTATRIFPASWGKEAVLENMVVKATQRIDSASGKLPTNVSSMEAAGRCVPNTRDPTARHKFEVRSSFPTAHQAFRGFTSGRYSEE